MPRRRFVRRTSNYEASFKANIVRLGVNYRF